MPILLQDGVSTTELPELAGEILSSLTNNVSTGDVIAVIGGIIVASIGFVFLWWGGRKGVKVLMNAIKTGKFKF